MRAKEFITEAVGGNYLYHGVGQGATFSAILKSGFIEPQEVFAFDRKKKGPNPDVISLSRDQFLRFPYGDAVAQFVVDKDALKRAGITAKPEVGAEMGRSESEERVFKPIPVKPPFVVAIQYDPNIKIPPAIFDRVKQTGVKFEPWKELPEPKYNDDDTPQEIPPAEKPFTNPNALELTKHKSDGKNYWTIYYRKSKTSSQAIYPYYNFKDEVAVKKAYAAIKDRIAKKLSFDDLLPPRRYGKSWSRGSYELGVL